MLGLTVLYIPREGQELSFEKASADRELVKRLEGVVVYWTHQIKSCLEDQAFVASQKELLCPSDEYDFWIYRREYTHFIYNSVVIVVLAYAIKLAT